MTISPKQYAAKAEELERLASGVSNSAMRNEYLELAKQLRRLAEKPLPQHSDIEIEELAQPIVGRSVSKL